MGVAGDSCEIPEFAKNDNLDVWDAFDKAVAHGKFCLATSPSVCPLIRHYANEIVESREILPAAHWVNEFGSYFSGSMIEVALEATDLSEDNKLGLFSFVNWNLYGARQVKLRLVELGLVDEFLLSQNTFDYDSEKFYADLPSSVRTEILL